MGRAAGFHGAIARDDGPSILFTEAWAIRLNDASVSAEFGGGEFDGQRNLGRSFFESVVEYSVRKVA